MVDLIERSSRQGQRAVKLAFEVDGRSLNPRRPDQPGRDHFKSGKLRPLAGTTATRADALPDVPPVAEFVPGYDVSAWYGVGAPKNTPAAIVDKLNKTINAGLADPKMKQKFAALGSQPYIATPAEFGKFTLAEAEKWAKVVKFAGIRAD